MSPLATYTPDIGLRGKLRRQATRLVSRRPARVAPERPMVSFTFDDAPETSLAAATMLEARGVRGTWFISTGLCGRDGHMGRYMDEAAVRRLAQAGHEIACHTQNHIDCGRADGATVEAELDGNALALAGLGVTSQTFAYPYGDLAPPAKRLMAQRFTLARTVTAGLVRRGSDLMQAPGVGIEGAAGEAKALGWLARAKAATAWAILYTHDVREGCSDFGTTPQTFARVLDHALAQGFEVITVAEGARRLRTRTAA